MTERAGFDESELYLARVLQTSITECNFLRAALILRGWQSAAGAQLDRLRDVARNPATHSMPPRSRAAQPH